jgi:3-dehydroquinate synthase
MITIDWLELIRISKEKRVFVLVDDFFQGHPVLDDLHSEHVFFCSALNAKSLSTVEKVWSSLLENHFTKHDFLIGVGGGSITDLTTFVAATYKRGIPHILVPTTLLAATDAAIGGKGGIDFGNSKNAVGAIKEPQFLVVQPHFFQTLAQEELDYGWAEVVKHALIGSTELYNEISLNRFQDVDYLVSKSIEFKKGIVEKDLMEQNWRKILNFGHTLGHALESFQNELKQPFSHGKCVVLGMLKEMEIMEKLGSLSSSEKTELTQWIKQIFPLEEINSIPWIQVLPYLKNDKKNEGNLIGFVEFCGVGKVNPEMKLSLQTVQTLLS